MSKENSTTDLPEASLHLIERAMKLRNLFKKVVILLCAAGLLLLAAVSKELIAKKKSLRAARQDLMSARAGVDDTLKQFSELIDFHAAHNIMALRELRPDANDPDPQKLADELSRLVTATMARSENSSAKKEVATKQEIIDQQKKEIASIQKQNTDLDSMYKAEVKRTVDLQSEKDDAIEKNSKLEQQIRTANEERESLSTRFRDVLDAATQPDERMLSVVVVFQLANSYDMSTVSEQFMQMFLSQNFGPDGKRPEAGVRLLISQFNGSFDKNRVPMPPSDISGVSVQELRENWFVLTPNPTGESVDAHAGDIRALYDYLNPRRQILFLVPSKAPIPTSELWKPGSTDGITLTRVNVCVVDTSGDRSFDTSAWEKFCSDHGNGIFDVAYTQPNAGGAEQLRVSGQIRAWAERCIMPPADSLLSSLNSATDEQEQ